MEKKTKLVEEEDGCYYYDYGGYGDGVVDDEGRATELRPMALSRPHTQAFHLAWMSLFACFFAAFAAPPILPAMRPALVLAPSDASAAAVASLSATLVGRLAMGPACDLLGPRRASGVASLVCALALALAAVFASSPAGFVALRFVAGLSLGQLRRQPALDVADLRALRRGARQRRRRRVGERRQRRRAGGHAGRLRRRRAPPRRPRHRRVARHLPTPVRHARHHRASPCSPSPTTSRAAAVVAAPGGGGGRRRSFWAVVRGGVGDYRAWLLGLTYGHCYGVELIMENVAADFFRRRFRLPMEAAGAAAACFGAMNAVARPAGGVASDEVARRFGMRGRLWALWAVQSAGAALCVLVGRMGAAEAPSLAATVAVMVACAAFVQAASGLTFGIVPFVCKRSLGVVSGMTASGGAVGAIVTNRLFFSGSRYTVEEAISCTGITSLLCTLPVALIHFRRQGGMFCGPSATIDGDGDVDDDDDYMLLK
ncbi:hypothetical protein OsJ_02167 [Oryza sativa Japonica Group]|nr:hypothetical protein OsJ_02167 [Oryza sativa Japonica Group]